MRIIDRYIARELLIPFGLGLAIFTFILLIARILKLVEMVVNRGVRITQILQLFSYILPAFLEVTVPMALLLAILVALGRLSADSEIIALQASGVGLTRLAVPIGAFAVGTALLTLALSVYVRPWGNNHLRTGLYEILKARASAGITPQVFNDDFKNLVIYVDRIEPPGNTLQGILISDTRDNFLHNTVFAGFGLIVTSEERRALTLRLLDGSIYTASTRPRGGFQTTRFSTYDITLDLDLAVPSHGPQEKDVSEMTLGELRAAIARKDAAHQPSLAERVELQRKWSIPFAALVFAALGIPLGIRQSRSAHSWGFSVSLALIFVYYLLLSLGQSLGERGALPPVVALWLPNILLSILAWVLFVRAGRGAGFSRAANRDWLGRLRGWA